MSDVMLLGILRMPIPDEPDALTLLQFVSAAREAANRIESNEWQEMDTAPKDRQILLDVGLPWPVAGAYNPIQEEWVYSNFALGLYQEKFNDSYFENEYEKTPKFWRELPKLRGQE